MRHYYSLQRRCGIGEDAGFLIPALMEPFDTYGRNPFLYSACESATAVVTLDRRPARTATFEHIGYGGFSTLHRLLCIDHVRYIAIAIPRPDVADRA